MFGGGLSVGYSAGFGGRSGRGLVRDLTDEGGGLSVSLADNVGRSTGSRVHVKNTQGRRDEHQYVNLLELHLDLGKKAFSNSDYSEAEKQYKLALKYEYDNYHANNSLSLIYKLQGDYLRAIACLERLKKSPSVSYKLAELYEEVKDYKNAIICYRNVGDVSGHSISAMHRLLKLYLREQDFHNAYSVFHNIPEEDRYEDKATLKIICQNLLDEFQESFNKLQQRVPQDYPSLIMLLKDLNNLIYDIRKYKFAKELLEQVYIYKKQFSPQNYLVLDKKSLIKLLEQVIQAQRPCFGSFFQPKYQELSQTLSFLQTRYPDKIYITQFLQDESFNNVSLKTLLQKRVICKSGPNASSYQFFIEKLNEHAKDLGNQVNKSLETPSLFERQSIKTFQPRVM